MSKKFIWGVRSTVLKSDEIKERLEALSDIKFSYVSDLPIDDNYSCFKLFVGRKYYIVKTKSIQWIERHLNTLLKAYNSNGMDAKDLYFPIVKQIHNTGYYDVQIEFIMQSDNPYEVIKAEFLELQDHVGKSLCLNKNKEPYMPKYNTVTKMHGWLTVNQYLNYKRLVKKYE
jgi:hypothetical protein